MLRLHVGRCDDDTRGNAIQLYQRQRGKQLVTGADQDMGAGQIGVQRAANAGQRETCTGVRTACASLPARAARSVSGRSSIFVEFDEVAQGHWENGGLPTR